MATPAEAWPQEPNGYDDVEALLNDRPVSAMVQGERRVFIHPGNFPEVHDAYLHNRDGEESPIYNVQRDQLFLRTRPAGQLITETLHGLHGDVGASSQVQELQAYCFAAPDRVTRDYYYSLLLDIAAEHLPEGLAKDILRDPWRYDDAT